MQSQWVAIVSHDELIKNTQALSINTDTNNGSPAHVNSTQARPVSLRLSSLLLMHSREVVTCNTVALCRRHVTGLDFLFCASTFEHAQTERPLHRAKQTA